MFASLTAFAMLAAPVLAQTTNRTAAGPSLPGGASSIQETYQDWQVSCQIVETTKRCSVSQQQVQQNGQRVLAIELQQGLDGRLAGSLILPFGLLLDNGVTLAVDDKQAGQQLRFRTCVPGGCIVALAFDNAMLTTLRTGTNLKLQATSTDGPTIPLALSLKGLGAALDRLKALAVP